MKPIYIPNFYNSEKIFNHLLNDLSWLEATEARKEYFFSCRTLDYTYGSGRGIRTYQSNFWTLPAYEVLTKLNNKDNSSYNVCFLNRYDNQKNSLDYHADDSPEMNPEHPIAVISFGAEREIWWKEKAAKGEIPPSQKQLLGNGSLFIMPAGFQENYVHKIPKAGKECGIRISLTFRNYRKLC